MKDHDKKIELHKKYKSCRNLLSTLKNVNIKILIKVFEDNWNKMKNTWKGIKSITLKKFSSNILLKNKRKYQALSWGVIH